MVAVPRMLPVTTPPINVTEAVAEALLLQVPPPVEFDSPTELPKHTIDGPAILAGRGFTVNTRVLKQPVVVSL
jgi:hypothetical protein